MLNQECIVAQVYDTHDLWHFLSSAALFFFFMVSWSPLLFLSGFLLHLSNLCLFSLYLSVRADTTCSCLVPPGCRIFFLVTGCYAVPLDGGRRRGSKAATRNPRLLILPPQRSVAPNAFCLFHSFDLNVNKL